MRRLWGLAAFTLILSSLVWFFGFTQTGTNFLTATMLQGRAWVFTKVQTLSGGIASPVSTLKDFSLSDPLTAPTASGTTGFGSCSSSETYKFVVAWENQSGVTIVSPLSGSVTPGSSSKQIPVTRPGDPPANALAWRVYFAKLSESYATVRECSSTVIHLAIATTVSNCSCSASGAAPSGSNTTGRRKVSTLGEELRGPSYGSTADVPITEDQNRVYVNAAYPRWSSDAGVTLQPVAVVPKNVKSVCLAGCEFTSVPSALAAITDAADGNRYAVLVYPGIDETGSVSLKSYVTIKGTAGYPNARIQTVNVPDSTTEAGLEDLRILNYVSKTAGGTGGTGGNIYVSGLVWDPGGSQNLTAIGGSNQTWYIRDSLIRCETSNCLGTITDTNIYASGNTYLATASNSAVWVFDTGAQLYDYGSHAEILTTSGGNSVNMFGLRLDGTILTVSRAGRVKLRNCSVNYSSSQAGRTGIFAGVAFNYAEPSVGTERIDLDQFSVYASSSGTEAVYGINTTGLGADADAGAIAIGWSGGRVSLSGGGTIADVDNAQTAAGMVIGLSGVVNGGVYTGAGNRPTALDARMGAFTSRLQGRIGDLVAATCTNNEIALDTGGANKEICVCDGGAWACTTVTTATGPTN